MIELTLVLGLIIPLKTVSWAITVPSGARASYKLDLEIGLQIGHVDLQKLVPFGSSNVAMAPRYPLVICYIAMFKNGKPSISFYFYGPFSSSLC